ncbi:MAG: hypothetical protein QM398_10440 [Thermoproteota archaeon]|jgi:hypothetical protein|nr:hypothetical protein [Thermoproteota archaeon]
MTQNSLNQVGGLDSKLVKIALTLISMVLLFAGPTYVPFLLAKVIGVEYFVSLGFGLSLFIVGFVLLYYLIRKRVVE